MEFALSVVHWLNRIRFPVETSPPVQVPAQPGSGDSQSPGRSSLATRCSFGLASDETNSLSSLVLFDPRWVVQATSEPFMATWSEPPPSSRRCVCLPLTSIVRPVRVFQTMTLSSGFDHALAGDEAAAAEVRDPASLEREREDRGVELLHLRPARRGAGRASPRERDSRRRPAQARSEASSRRFWTRRVKELPISRWFRAGRSLPAVRGSAHSGLEMSEATGRAATASPSPEPDRVETAVREARDDAAPFALVAAAILIALALVAKHAHWETLGRSLWWMWLIVAGPVPLSRGDAAARFEAPAPVTTTGGRS